MKEFKIDSPDKGIENDIIEKINFLTKPKGSLGFLEELALRVSLIQQTLSPCLKNPYNVLFGGDHGVIEEGISLSPKEVTYQQMIHFATGTSGINFLCNQHGFKLMLVDAGVDFDFPEELGILCKKISRGTRNYLHEDAMSIDEMNEAIEAGGEGVRKKNSEGWKGVRFWGKGSGKKIFLLLLVFNFGGFCFEGGGGGGAGVVFSGGEN